jgi:hypothetical protein
MAAIQNNPASRSARTSAPTAPAAPAAAAAPAAPVTPAAPATAPRTDSFQAGPSAAKAFGSPAAPSPPPSLVEIRMARDAAGLKSTSAPKLSPELYSPTRAAVSTADIRGLERTAGQDLSVADLAKAFPNARINGKGATLAEIAKKSTGKVGSDGLPITLGAATIDKNGDLDVSDLYRKEIAANNQNLLIKKGDELPVPLSYTAKNGDLRVREEAHKQALAKAGFPTKDGDPMINLRDAAAVNKALQALGVDPSNKAQIAQELQKQGVKVPLSEEDQARRVLLAKLDSSKNEVVIDKHIVENPGDHNQGIQPTVYASAKVSPEHLDDTVLLYKRYNNQSYAAQGNWVASVIGKHSQHQFDQEATFVKINTTSHELEQVMSARHYFGEVFNKSDIDALKQRTGRDDLTTAVSYLGHGSRLADTGEKDTWAGQGDDGVHRFDIRDHILKDQFMGLNDAKSGGAMLIPKEKVNLVVESDDKQSLNLDLHFGETRKGILGTSIADVYNDGMAPDRFGGTDWYYQHEKLAGEKTGLEKFVDGAVDKVKDFGAATVDTAKKVGHATAEGFSTAKRTVSNFLKKLTDW